MENRGHPLAGRSSRHRFSCGEEFLFSSPIVSTRQRFDRPVTRPCFRSVGVGFWSAPVTHQDQGCGRILKKISSPPLATILAPENCRYHAVPKVIGFTNPLAHPVRGPTQVWLTAWAYHLIKSFPSCLVSGTEQRLIKSRGCEPTPLQAHYSIPAVKLFFQANALLTSKGIWSFMM
jgi:hypothetical protein